MCIQEMKWTGQRAEMDTRFCGGKSKRNGVGVILDPDWKSAVVEVVRHSDRLMLVKAVQGDVINIISAYAQQAGCTEEENDSFIEELEALVRAVPPTERLVVGADMNGHVRSVAEEYEGVHGGYGLWGAKRGR